MVKDCIIISICIVLFIAMYYLRKSIIKDIKNIIKDYESKD